MLITDQDKIREYCIPKHALIVDALSRIELNNRHTLIVSSESLIYGVISQGDIRKAILHSISTMSIVEPFVNRNPITLLAPEILRLDSLDREALKLYSLYPWIDLIPIANQAGHLIAISLK